MEGVSIVPTETLQALIGSVERLELTVMSTIAELKEAKKLYLTAQDLMEITGFSKTWVNDNKQLVGFSMVGGCLRFKRADVLDFMDKNYCKAKKSRS